jgi:hypothetical protein
MRYLDIIKYFEGKKHCYKGVPSELPSIPHRKKPGNRHALNVINVKRPQAWTPDMWVQWNTQDNGASIGKVLLPPKKGWMIIQEFLPGERMVFVHTKTGITVMDPRPIDMPEKGGTDLWRQNKNSKNT